MNVLSLFDGMSCGMIALERAGVKVDNYYASEIDKHAIKVSEKNYPSIIRMGDVTKWRDWDIDWSSIDLVIGGSPCQSFSRSGDGSGFDGKSGLFFDFLDVCEKVADSNPKMMFLLENVEMKKEWENVITAKLGVNPVHIDSSLVSAQKRPRVYWTNIPGVTIPKDNGVTILNILDHDADDYIENHPVILGKYIDGRNGYMVRNATKRGYLDAFHGDCINLEVPTSKTRRGRVSSLKTNTLNTACNYAVVLYGRIRKLSILEYERLQTLPDGYTSGVSMAQRKKMIGNGWTVDVIAHIFKGLKR